MEVPGHFMLALLLIGVAGGILGFAVQQARVNDALRNQREYRLETARIARERNKVYDTLLKERLSSDDSPQAEKLGLSKENNP